MIVAIVGSRCEGRAADRCSNIVKYAISVLPSGVIIMSGGAKTGADFWAKKWALEFRRQYIEAPANWGGLGLGAGFARNKTIVEVSDMILSVWDGKSRGTKDTMDIANAVGRPLWVVQL